MAYVRGEVEPTKCELWLLPKPQLNSQAGEAWDNSRCNNCICIIFYS